MKATLYTTLRLVTIFLILINSPLFANNHIESVFANQNFQITHQPEEITIDITKNPWESFTLAVNSNEILRNPIVNLDIKTSEAITIRVDLTDGVFMSKNADIVQEEISMANNFTTIAFDFTELIHDIDLTDVVYLIFYVNPGEYYKGQISIRNFNLSSETQNPFLENQSGFKMFPAPATTFTNIEIPNADFTTLSVIGMNGTHLQTADISNYNGSTYTLYLNDLPAGYYSVQISGKANHTVSEKLIIN